jgi:hypothetical protein
MTLGWSVPRSSSSLGTESATFSSSRAPSSAATLPELWTKASLLQNRYAEPGKSLAPRLFARAKPTLRSTRTSTEDGSASRIAVHVVDVGPFSTTTIRCGGTPSSTRLSTERIV